MDAIIYYFSGTGNSFAVAKDIAENIDAQMISIPAIIGGKQVKITGGIVGIVFPDYHSSLSTIVKRFLNTIDLPNNQYVFAVCTYGGRGPGLTIAHVKREIEKMGGNLAAGFAVRMPYNYIVPAFSFKKCAVETTLKQVPVEEQTKMFSEWEKKCEVITDFINSRKEGVYETSAELLLKFIDFIKIRESVGKYIWLKMAGYTGNTSLSFSESRKLMDHAFYANETCIACGTCEKICPVSNITLIENKPTWNHTCEQCFACLQWCPRSAIQFGKNMENKTRYHHPLIHARDLMI
ncbi:MAG: 4Fe-4S dicluster domain-containing protein [Theionarchaea archaeon]|nr:4Fe-4S dicluster domain-containing protein [Theionarchaea archaeon]